MSPAIRDTSNLKLASARCGTLPNKYACISDNAHESHIELMSTSPSQPTQKNQVHAEAVAVHGGLRAPYHRRRNPLSNPPGPRFQSGVQPCGTGRPSWARKAWRIDITGMRYVKVSYLSSGIAGVGGRKSL